MTTVAVIRQENLMTVLGFPGDSSENFRSKVRKNQTVHRRIVLPPDEIRALRETVEVRILHRPVVFGIHLVLQLLPPQQKQRIVLSTVGAKIASIVTWWS